ncbi:MAG: hypothetical protein ILO68_07415, partial [Clostridia bacterium]|nr:hypothetical protein [Clostridia bacterium]
KTGKGMGKSFAGLGKSIVKSAKVGIDELSGEPDEKQEKNPNGTGLKESWKSVGKSFGETGADFGKALAGTAKKVTDSLDAAVNKDEQENGETAPENGGAEKKEE